MKQYKILKEIYLDLFNDNENQAWRVFEGILEVDNGNIYWIATDNTKYISINTLIIISDYLKDGSIVEIN